MTSSRSPFRCYVAAPFRDAPFVREVHVRLRALGLAPTSTWAEPRAAAGDAEDGPDGTPEDLAALPLTVVRDIAARNDHALASSDVVLVLPCVGPKSAGGGREMYAEARLALAFGIPVVWVGGARDRPLSAYREGVARVDTLAEGLAELRRMAGLRARPSEAPLRESESEAKTAAA